MKVKQPSAAFIIHSASMFKSTDTVSNSISNGAIVAFCVDSTSINLLNPPFWFKDVFITAGSECFYIVFPTSCGIHSEEVKLQKTFRITRTVPHTQTRTHTQKYRNVLYNFSTIIQNEQLVWKYIWLQTAPSLSGCGHCGCALLAFILCYLWRKKICLNLRCDFFRHWQWEINESMRNRVGLLGSKLNSHCLSTVLLHLWC